MLFGQVGQKRIDTLRKILALAAAVLLAPSPGAALDGSVPRGSASIGSCGITYESQDGPSGPTAGVLTDDRTNASNRTHVEGGTDFTVGPFLDFEIAGCLGGTAGEVTNLTQTGVTAATFASASYVGLAFDFRGDRYEYALVGVTGTVFRQTVTPIAGPGAETEDIASNFLQHRANNLAANQTSLLPFIRGGGSGVFDGGVTREAGSFSFVSSPTRPVWASLRGAWSEYGATDTSYVLGAVGTHTWITENILLGGMLQYDHARDQNGVAEVEGTGWLVGPYVAARHPTQPLYFEARLLYGHTDNKISPLGTYTDDFDGERWFGQARITGESKQEQLTLFPYLDFSHVSEKQDAYVDGLSNAVAGQSIRLSTLSLGLDFSHPLPAQTGALTLIGGVSGVWSDTSGSGTAAGIVPGGDTTRGRIELGLDYQLHSNKRLALGTFYDGIGASDYDSYGMSFSLDTKF